MWFNIPLNDIRPQRFHCVAVEHFFPLRFTISSATDCRPNFLAWLLCMWWAASSSEGGCYTEYNHNSTPVDL